MKLGYKATIDLTYEVGQTYEMEEIEMCGKGFHYCKRIEDTLRYYKLKDGLTFIEIEDLGDSVEGGDKTVTNKIKVLRIVPVEELGWLTKPIKFEYLDGSWETYEYDKNCNLIRYEDSTCYWETYEYDEHGLEINSKNFFTL